MADPTMHAFTAAQPLFAALPPRPLRPLSAAVVDHASVSFQWEGVDGARGYRLQIAPDRQFGRGVTELDVGQSTDFTLVDALPVSGSQLFWRVRAEFEDGPSRWSPYGRFLVGSDDAAMAYDAQREAERIEARKAYLRERAQAETARDLVPYWERDDTIPSDVESGALWLAMLLSFVLTILLIAFVLAL